MKVIHKETKKYIGPTSKIEMYAIINSGAVSGQEAFPQ